MATVSLPEDLTTDDAVKAWGFNPDELGDPEGDDALEQETAPAAAAKPAAGPQHGPEVTKAKRTVPLAEPQTVKGITFDTLLLRAPRGVDYWEFGAPYGHHPDGAGHLTFVEYPAVIKLYAGFCVVPPKGLTSNDVIDSLGMLDTMALRRAVLDFFTARPATSTNSGTSP